MFVAIEGSIACGKSTTAELLAESLGTTLVLEQSSRHPFLTEFYADPVAFALETELAFVLIHYHQLHPLSEVGDIVSDFSPVKDLVFADMNLEGSDKKLFLSVYHYLLSRVRIPDVVVFLDLPAEILKQRVVARGRPFEANLPLPYLHSLREYYFRHLDALGTKVMVVEVHPGQGQRQVADLVDRLIANHLRRPIG